MHPSRGPAPNVELNILENMNKCNISLTSDSLVEFYTKVISVTSILAPIQNRLTDIEIRTLALFLSLPKEHEYYPFSAPARKIVTKLYDGSITIQLLSARLSSLIDKGYLVRDDDNFINFTPHIKKLRNIDTFNALLLYQPISGSNIQSNKSSTGKSR